MNDNEEPSTSSPYEAADGEVTISDLIAFHIQQASASAVARTTSDQAYMHLGVAAGLGLALATITEAIPEVQSLRDRVLEDLR